MADKKEVIVNSDGECLIRQIDQSQKYSVRIEDKDIQFPRVDYIKCAIRCSNNSQGGNTHIELPKESAIESEILHAIYRSKVTYIYAAAVRVDCNT